MNILIPVITLGNAGGHKVLSTLSCWWSDYGHKVTFVTNEDNNLPYYKTKGEILYINSKGMISKRKGNSMKIKPYQKVQCLYYFIKNNAKQYDIILANSWSTAYPVYLGNKDKKKNYYYVQAYEPEFYQNKNIRSRILYFMAWFTYFLPLKKIVNSDLYKKFHNLRSDIVIGPGIDLSVFYPKRLISSKEEYVMGCIGRLEKWKGTQDVIDAYEMVSKRHKNIRLKIAFYGPQKYEHCIEKPDTPEKLAAFYRSLDILIAPGTIQLGAVHYPVIEGLACGVPLITTGYYPATPDNSFLVPINSPRSIADTVEYIMNNYDIAIQKSLKSSEKIRELSWDRVSQKFIEIFIQQSNEK